MEINSLITKRKSIRAFDSKPIELVKLKALFEAARWAASSFNEQPWHFIYAEKKDKIEYDHILNTLTDNNKSWAKSAPLLIAVVAKMNFSRNNKLNRHAFYDTGMAVQNLALQATEMGLFLHQMAGFNREQAIKDLHVPSDCDVIAIIAVGYRGDVKTLPKELQQREQAERQRKPINDMIHKGMWSG